ncbi:MAG TPA: S41 family peptidase [Candidatus Woesebacteria bacterium]|nr:S41 family peptidase [Candidatus Woesebacteria bacterium]HPR99587.1 S41 family peptidase [Candidatus Woesebacteria bacterium]
MQKQIKNIFLFLALFSVISLVSFKVGKTVGLEAAGSNQKTEALDLSLMWKVKEKLEDEFLEKDKLKDEEMTYGAISGMVSALGDPYTVFLAPKQNKSSNADLAGEFGGVGIQLGYKEKSLAVMAPLAKTPADRAGIKAGDLILKIIDKENNVDRDTAGITLEEAVELIRGKVGTEVTLKLYREGEKDTFEVKLIRDNIVVPSMETEWIKKEGKSVIWVKLYKFSEQIYNDWPKAVENIISEKKRLGNDYGGIILDLRNNPGGYLQASVLVASDFLKDGVVVTQRSADGKEEKYMVDTSRGNLLNDKLVVLINEGSASAAEILAGAIKGYGRGKLVGMKSFGKGTVQSPVDFADGSGLHVTIAKWLLPDGKNIHGEGVLPDVEEKWNINNKDQEDNQLDKAVLEVLK